MNRNIRKILSIPYHIVRDGINNIKVKRDASRLDKYAKEDDSVKRVYYLGVTAHSNLGDLAQHYCITKWIMENYPDYELIMFRSDTVVAKKSNFIKKFKAVYHPHDIIVFQSGYTTQDLGGNHENMHRIIVDNMPEANILMMPQTIFFVHEENKQRCADSLNKANHMLFLARDFVSYEMAKEMFPNVTVKAYPDIVTTLIGTMRFDNERKGVCLCTRNDGEKLYSKEEIDDLAQVFISDRIKVVQKDTQARQNVSELLNNLQHYIESEIETYSHYEVTITDRYHGTIFSLCAGTPVIIIKTTDHKVTTGADWFKGVYDDYVYVAEDLKDAYRKAIDVMKKKLDNRMRPYFKKEYYDKLRAIFAQNVI